MSVGRVTSGRSIPGMLRSGMLRSGMLRSGSVMPGWAVFGTLLTSVGNGMASTSGGLNPGGEIEAVKGSGPTAVAGSRKISLKVGPSPEPVVTRAMATTPPINATTAAMPIATRRLARRLGCDRPGPPPGWTGGWCGGAGGTTPPPPLDPPAASGVAAGSREGAADDGAGATARVPRSGPHPTDARFG